MGAYRPPQWQAQLPQTIIITFPGQPQAAQYSSASGVSASLPTSQTQYVFDAVIVAEHGQSLTKTKHPVQTGASISDHIYIEPADLILDVGMSDAMDAYFNPSTWTGSPSKSVAAYQTLLALAFARIPLTITTRLRTYTNMVITDLPAQDTVKTIQGLRARITFGQLFLADVTSAPVSARNQDTDATNLGAVNTVPPTTAQNQQNQVPPTYHPWDSIGAGDYSSVNQSLSGSLPAK